VAGYQRSRSYAVILAFGLNDDFSYGLFPFSNEPILFIIRLMRKLADRLWEFKDKLTPLLQPITEAELYLFLHAEPSADPVPSGDFAGDSKTGLLA